MLVRVVGTVILEEKLANAFDEPCSVVNVFVPMGGKLRVCCHHFQVDRDLDKVLNSGDATTCNVTYLIGNNQLYCLLDLLRFVYCQIEPMRQRLEWSNEQSKEGFALMESSKEHLGSY